MMEVSGREASNGFHLRGVQLPSDWWLQLMTFCDLVELTLLSGSSADLMRMTAEELGRWPFQVEELERNLGTYASMNTRLARLIASSQDEYQPAAFPQICRMQLCFSFWLTQIGEEELTIADALKLIAPCIGLPPRNPGIRLHVIRATNRRLKAFKMMKPSEFSWHANFSKHVQLLHSSALDCCFEKCDLWEIILLFEDTATLKPLRNQIAALFRRSASNAAASSSAAPVDAEPGK